MGVNPPKKVRLYARREHYVLQWWDKQDKRTLSERIDGDLVAAITRARQIDEQLKHFKSSRRTRDQISHTAIVDGFITDLQRRADAGEIDLATVRRYAAPLRRYYLDFVNQPKIGRSYRNAAAIDRSFQMAFAAFLNNLQVSPNGHPNGRRRPLKQQAFILDVVRAMLEWAADPDRGNLLPDRFRNPFARRARETRKVAPDLLSQPDISVQMAVDLVGACDQFQLRIFAPLVLYGLRPGELSWLFQEYVDDDWLRVPCNPDLDYLTKGRRQKSFPLVDCMRQLWSTNELSGGGLLYVHRRAGRRKRLPLVGKSLAELVEEFQRRCAVNGPMSAEQRREVRNKLMKQAGQLNYDHIEAEFKALSRSLNWPAEATLKDLRHLFATCLENAGVPEFYRRYLMGQSFGRAPIVTYTHVTEDQLRKHYLSALAKELAPLAAAIEQQFRDVCAIGGVPTSL